MYQRPTTTMATAMKTARMVEVKLAALFNMPSFDRIRAAANVSSASGSGNRT
jgi:hypothetical protein